MWPGEMGVSGKKPAPREWTAKRLSVGGSERVRGSELLHCMEGLVGTAEGAVRPQQGSGGTARRSDFLLTSNDQNTHEVVEKQERSDTAFTSIPLV